MTMFNFMWLDIDLSWQSSDSKWLDRFCDSFSDDSTLTRRACDSTNMTRPHHCSRLPNKTFKTEWQEWNQNAGKKKEINEGEIQRARKSSTIMNLHWDNWPVCLTTTMVGLVLIVLPKGNFCAYVNRQETQYTTLVISQRNSSPERQLEFSTKTSGLPETHSARHKLDCNISTHTAGAFSQNMKIIARETHSALPAKVSMRSKKWYFNLFTNCLDVALANAWTLHWTVAEKPMTL